MKIFPSIILATASLSVVAAPDTIRVSQFGVYPNTYENSVTGIQAAIDSCRSNPGSVLLFEKGRYDIWPEGACARKSTYRILPQR